MPLSKLKPARTQRLARRAALAAAGLALCVAAAVALPLASIAVAPVQAEPLPPVVPIGAMSAAAVANASVVAPVVAAAAVEARAAGVVAVVPPAAAAPQQPVAVEPPRLDPPAIPHGNVLSTTLIYHELLTPPPLQALQADLAADAVGELQEAPGRGISQAVTPISSGLTLHEERGAALVITLMPAGRAAPAAHLTMLPVALTPAVGRTVIGVTAPAQTPVVTKQGEIVAAPIAAPTAVGGGKTVYSPNLILPAEATGVEVPAAAPVVQSGAQIAAPAGKNEGSALAQSYTLVDQVCLDFNARDDWASQRVSEPSDVWTDWFAGWAPFAVDDGLYQARNVTFSLERVAGPGINYGPNAHSAKIASNQPYAAGFGSPLIQVRPGSVVIVSANYLIFDHDTHGDDYDWASLGIKPDAALEGATYVNGFVRGRWATLTHHVVAGETGAIMVLLQAHSPAALNSNIYFDNVRIWVDGLALADCRYE